MHSRCEKTSDSLSCKKNNESEKKGRRAKRGRSATAGAALGGVPLSLFLSLSLACLLARSNQLILVGQGHHSPLPCALSF